MLNNKKRKVYLTEKELLDDILSIINSREKNKFKKLTNIIFLEKKFPITESFQKDINKEITTQNDIELANFYIVLQKKLLTKYDSLGDKLKTSVSLAISERLGINDEISRIFEENNISLLRKSLDALQISTNSQKELPDKLNHNNSFLLFLALLFKFHRSFNYDSILWHFTHIISNSKSRNEIKFNKPQIELFDQLVLLFQRKNGIKQVKGYYKKTGPFYKAYLDLTEKSKKFEEESYIEKRQNIEKENKLNELYTFTSQLENQISNLKEEINKLKIEIGNNSVEAQKNLDNQNIRNQEIISIEKKSLYSKIKKDIDFCFQEITLGLEIDYSKITEDKIDLILQRVEKTKKYLNEIGDNL